MSPDKYQLAHASALRLLLLAARDEDVAVWSAHISGGRVVVTLASHGGTARVAARVGLDHARERISEHICIVTGDLGGTPVVVRGTHLSRMPVESEAS